MDNLDTKNISGVWSAVGWVFLLGFLAVGGWWLFHIPSVGYGGVLLAVGATLMPIFWEKVGSVGKASWLAMLFLLFGVEYRAIDKEHADYAREQAYARKEERDSFKVLLESEKSDVRGILDQEQKHFDKVIGEVTNAQREQTRQFSALLRRENDLFVHEEQLAEALNGRLLPASDPMPDLCKNGRVLASDDVVIVLGGNVFVTNKFPHVVVASTNGQKLVSMDRSADGSIVLLADIRSGDGRIITRLNQDGFVVNRSNYLSMKKDKSSLVVEDEYGAEVLRARYMNRQAFSLDVTVRFIGGRVQMPDPSFTGNCAYHSHGPDLTVKPD